MSNPIKDFMTPMPHTIGHDMTTSKAQEMMKEFSCHHLPVLDGGKLVGILSDKDLKTVAKISGSEDIKIEDLMTDEPVVVEREMDVYQAAMLMHQKKIGSVIVSASPGEPWGIFTATDALNYLAKNK